MISFFIDRNCHKSLAINFLMMICRFKFSVDWDHYLLFLILERRLLIWQLIVGWFHEYPSIQLIPLVHHIVYYEAHSIYQLRYYFWGLTWEDRTKNLSIDIYYAQLLVLFSSITILYLLEHYLIFVFIISALISKRR